MSDDLGSMHHTSVEDLEGRYWYDKSNTPRWSILKDVDTEGDHPLFITEGISAEKVPQEVRERAYENYDGKTMVLEGPQ